MRRCIEFRLLLYLAGNNDASQLRALASDHPEEMAEAITGLAAIVAGDGRERLAHLAFTLSLIDQWCGETRAADPARRRKAFSRLETAAVYPPAYRTAEGTLARGLRDPDEGARLAAGSALAQGGGSKELGDVFELALGEAPANRQKLSRMLRPHAALLARAAVLAGSPTGRLLAVLDVFECWECALGLEDLGPFATHPDATVRARTMRLLTRVPMTAENQRALIAGLADPELLVSVAAAESAGRLRISSAVPALERCLGRGADVLAQAAAKALAEIQSKTQAKEPAGQTA